MSASDRGLSGPTLGLAGLRAVAAAWRRTVPAGSPGRPDLVVATSIDSTQRWARTLLNACLEDDGEPESYCCAALTQRVGRGRDRRSWVSGSGGVYATLVCRTTDEAGLQTLPARTAVAIADRLNEVVGGRCRIKWPNDLMVGPRKIGGLLVDAVTPPSGPPWALVGFGVNHSQRDFGSAAAVATSVAAEVGLSLPFFEEFLVDCISAVHEAMAEVAPDWLDRYRELSAHAPGDAVRARLAEATVEGTFAGFDANGFLILDGEEGRRILRAGEVFAW